MFAAVNMTSFFKRPLVLYSIGDFKLKKPISFTWMGYLAGAILGWSLPVIYLFGFHLNVYFTLLVVVPPLLFARYASRPVFGGKKLIDFVITMIGYFGEPRGWSDLRADKNAGKNITYFVSQEIWISRRREIEYLASLREKRRAMKEKTSR